MKKQTKVTIGIPAYNEEANIGFLLQDILHQKERSFKLEKIIIYSDGSTDKTVAISNRIKNKKIKVIKSETRKGAWFGQNQIIKSCKSDVLVLFNADIRINRPLFIHHLIDPISSGKADLTSGNLMPLPPKIFIEKILYVSVLIKKEIYKNYKNGNNVYTCHGQSRAFSKKLYQRFKFENKLGEDAFSYFYCIKNGFKYSFVENAKGYYKLPDNWRDHEKQSLRFFKSRTQYKKDPLKNLANSQYYIPPRITLSTLFKYYIEYPIETLLYLLSLTYIRFKSMFANNINTKWDVAISSKKLT